MTWDIDIIQSKYENIINAKYLGHINDCRIL